MSVEDDRNGFFAALRESLTWDEFSLAHDQSNFLLASAPSALRNYLQEWYQSARKEMNDDISEKYNRYHQTKKLSDGATWRMFQIIREHQFWVDVYMKFHEEFEKNDLLPKKGDKK